MFSLRSAVAAQVRRCSAVQSRVLPCGSKATGRFTGEQLAEGTLLAADGTKRSGVFEGGTLKAGKVYLPDGRVYTASFDNGIPHTGTLEDEGSTYEGGFNTQWQRHGEGTERTAEGALYEGRFEEDWLSEGTVTLPERPDLKRSEVVFKGKLVGGKFRNGSLVYNGIVYTGELRASNPHGKGRLEMPDGSVREGRFEAGVLNGNGQVILKNGTVLSGDFEKGTLPNGSVKWTQGDMYEGDLDEQHRPHGDGSMFKAAERHWWSGQWTHGTFSGGSVTDDGGAPVDYRTAPPDTAL